MSIVMKSGIALDLDNTMIGSATMNKLYSDKSLVVDVSALSGVKIEMSIKAFNLYQELSRQKRLIAVTTRSKSQYQRTTLANHSASAIYDNGATIEFEGVVNESWSDKIQLEYSNLTLNSLDIMNCFISSFGSEYVETVDKFDYFGIVYLTPDGVKKMIQEFEKLNFKGFKTTFQGRKFYIIPEFINKGRALKHVVDVLGIDYLESAGDSLPDLDMFQISNFCHVSPWGELENTNIPYPHKLYEKHENAIALTGEEILINFCGRNKYKAI